MEKWQRIAYLKALLSDAETKEKERTYTKRELASFFDNYYDGCPPCYDDCTECPFGKESRDDGCNDCGSDGWIKLIENELGS